MHAVGHYLNPEFFYLDSNIFEEEEIMMGLYKALQRLVLSHKEQEKISDCHDPRVKRDFLG